MEIWKEFILATVLIVRSRCCYITVDPATPPAP